MRIICFLESERLRKSPYEAVCYFPNCNLSNHLYFQMYSHIASVLLDTMCPLSIFIFFKSLSCVRLFVTSWTAAHQAPQSMGFSRQEYWSGLPFPSPGDLPNPGIKPGSPTLEADALTSEPPGKPPRSQQSQVLKDNQEGLP